MKKQYSILSLALSLFFLSVLTGNNAQAQQAKSDVSVSRAVSAGQTAADGRPMVVVTVTITKYAFKGPARIVETFPSNFQAVLISSNHASFQASNGQAQFTWSDIQSDRTVAVSYALEAMGNGSATQNIDGKLFYQNQAFTIAESSFTIDVSNLKPYVASSSPTDMSGFDQLYYNVTGNYAPDYTPPPTPVAVASPAQSSGNNVASSTMSNSSQPAQQSSSTLPPSQQEHLQTMTNSGQQNAANTSNTTPAQQQPVAIMNNSSTQQSSTTTTSTPAATSTSTQQQPVATTTTPAQQQQPAPTMTTPAPRQTTSTPVATSTPASSANSVSGDVVYHVQVIVVGDKSKLQGFFTKYGITDQKYYDPADGLPVRVMVGNYNNYNAAKARCTELKGKGLTEAFVTAYSGGQRITLAQAATHK